MNLTELKQKSASELLELAKELGVENISRARKQDVIFSILISQPNRFYFHIVTSSLSCICYIIDTQETFAYALPV